MITYSELVQMFFESVVPGQNPDDCWRWKGSLTHGYAFLSYNGRRIKGSRLSWEIHSGLPLKDGYIMCHSCNNPECCNPRHVAPDTHKHNMDYMRACGRERHPKGNELSLKLTSDQVTQLRADYATGHYSFRTLGNKYGVSKTHARNVCRGKKWSSCQTGITPNQREQTIRDEFTDAPVSRGMRYYLRKMRKREEKGEWLDGRAVHDEFSSLKMSAALRYYYRRIKKQLPCKPTKA